MPLYLITLSTLITIQRMNEALACDMSCVCLETYYYHLIEDSVKMSTKGHIPFELASLKY